VTEDQVIAWLGFPATADLSKWDRWPAVVAGLAAVPMPTNDLDRLAAFQVFLKHAGPPPKVTLHYRRRS
jgi:hypothetical protein